MGSCVTKKVHISLPRASRGGAESSNRSMEAVMAVIIGPFDELVGKQPNNTRDGSEPADKDLVCKPLTSPAEVGRIAIANG